MKLGLEPGIFHIIIIRSSIIIIGGHLIVHIYPQDINLYVVFQHQSTRDLSRLLLELILINVHPFQGPLIDLQDVKFLPTIYP